MIDRNALRELIKRDPDQVTKAEAELREALQDPVVEAALAVSIHVRRLGLVALAATTCRLEKLCSNHELAFALLRESHEAFKNVDGFTVVDVEAQTHQLVIPFFDLLAAHELFQQQIQVQHERGTSNPGNVCDTAGISIAGVSAEPGRPAAGAAEVPAAPDAG